LAGGLAPGVEVVPAEAVEPLAAALAPVVAGALAAVEHPAAGQEGPARKEQRRENG
jgi:hypothetical protein